MDPVGLLNVLGSCIGVNSNLAKSAVSCSEKEQLVLLSRLLQLRRDWLCNCANYNRGEKNTHQKNKTPWHC